MVPNIWEDFLSIIREEEGSRIVETWFKAISLQQWDSSNKIVYLEAPNTFVREWISSNYMALLQLHLGRLLHVNAPRIVLSNSTSGMHDIQSNGSSKLSEHYLPAERYSKAKVPTVYSRNQINHGYSFDSFIVGPHNSLAHAAAYAVTEKPGKIYNPLFIYGGSGLGKTHLLHAIGNQIKMQCEKAVVLYQTTDRFVNEFINAIRFDKIHKFQLKYKNVDVLLIDDIQFITNKEQTQEAFFHIFNTLYDAHKQIVFSSDTFPHEIKGLAERLQSRLAWGLVADIHVPSLETKIAILKKKAELSNEVLNDDVANFIASCVDSNIRELEGSLIRVTAFSLLTKQPITLELAKKVLMRSNESKSKIDFNQIMKVIGKHYSYRIDEIKSKKRDKDLSFVRHLTILLMKRMTDKSLREIGAFLGGRDHTTVVHALRKMQSYLDANPDFYTTLKNIEADIFSGH